MCRAARNLASYVQTLRCKNHLQPLRAKQAKFGKSWFHKTKLGPDVVDQVANMSALIGGTDPTKRSIKGCAKYTEWIGKSEHRKSWEQFMLNSFLQADYKFGRVFLICDYYYLSIPLWMEESFDGIVRHITSSLYYY